MTVCDTNGSDSDSESAVQLVGDGMATGVQAGDRRAGWDLTEGPTPRFCTSGCSLSAS